MSDIILFITFLAVCFYSYETYKLRQETTKAMLMNFLSIQTQYYTQAGWPHKVYYNWPSIVKNIMENGKVDLNDFFNKDHLKETDK